MEEVRSIQAELANLRETTALLDDPEEFLALVDRQQRAYERLAELLGEMLQGGDGQDPDLGFRIMVEVEALKEETKGARKKWRGLWDSIWRKLKAALPHIWRVISHLLTVKEWTLSGQAGNNLFGLGNVGISVTFGK